MWRARSRMSSCTSGVSWVEAMKSAIVRTPAPGRDSRLMIVACVIRIREVSSSGRPVVRCSKVFSDHDTKPAGGCFFVTFRRFFGSSPAFARAFVFSMTCSGACTTT